MRYAIIETGKVINIASSDSALANNWVQSNTAQIGYLYNKGTFTPPGDTRVLEEEKTKKKSDITAERNRRQNATAPTPKGVVQCDSASKDNINGAVLMAILASQTNTPFEITWTMADNTNIPHTGPEIIAMGQAVGSYVGSCHAQGIILKSQVDAAKTLAEVDAIDITVGWP